jgi:hypothetical protein
MASAIVAELRKAAEAASDRLNRQLQDMEPYMDRTAAPGEWTPRQVLCHLLLDPAVNPVALLKSFAISNPPTLEITTGQSNVSGWREFMSLGQFREALDDQRSEIFDYLEALSERDLGRKARIPPDKQLVGTEEVSIPVFVRAIYDRHWSDHVAQLAKIRKAVGLPDA